MSGECYQNSNFWKSDILPFDVAEQ